MLLEGTTEGWLMVAISSLSCVIGASIVILGGKTLENKKFLSASMALGGGVLIFNSLYTLLPASRQKFDSNLLTFICFFIGVLFTVFLSYVIQLCTPHAIHTCDPTNISKTSTNNINEVVIVQILQEEQDTMKPISPAKHHHHHEHYGSIQVTTTTPSTSNTKNDYFLIGIQTAIAICIHKFPEGLIMFISNESSSQLGLSVAAAMTIHNFIEGFLIALPLFYATGSKFAAFSYAALLGGMSQPLGAILGLLAIRNVEQLQEDVLFGIIFGIVSGMMCLIAVQSMLPQAIRSDKSQKLVPIFFFTGIFLIGLASLLQST